MSYPDLGSAAQAITSVAPAVYTSTENGTTVDTKGFRFAYIVAHLGVLGANMVVKVQDSPDDSTWTDITGATMTAVNGTDEDSVLVGQVDTQSTARYVRVVALATVGEGIAAAVVLHFSKDSATYAPTTLEFSV